MDNAISSAPRPCILTHNEDKSHLFKLQKLTIPFVMALLSLRVEVGSIIAKWVRNAGDQREAKF